MQRQVNPALAAFLRESMLCRALISGSLAREIILVNAKDEFPEKANTSKQGQGKVLKQAFANLQLVSPCSPKQQSTRTRVILSGNP